MDYSKPVKCPGCAEQLSMVDATLALDETKKTTSCKDDYLKCDVCIKAVIEENGVIHAQQVFHCWNKESQHKFGFDVCIECAANLQKKQQDADQRDERRKKRNRLKSEAAMSEMNSPCSDQE